MSKSILFVMFGLIGSAALAAEPTVEITSFTYAGSRTRTAELCGKITGASTYPVVVKVTVDPKMKEPGNYSVFALGEKFCTTVVTASGTAEMEVWK